MQRKTPSQSTNQPQKSPSAKEKNKKEQLNSDLRFEYEQTGEWETTVTVTKENGQRFQRKLSLVPKKTLRRKKIIPNDFWVAIWKLFHKEEITCLADIDYEYEEDKKKPSPTIELTETEPEWEEVGMQGVYFNGVKCYISKEKTDRMLNIPLPGQIVRVTSKRILRKLNGLISNTLILKSEHYEFLDCVVRKWNKESEQLVVYSPEEDEEYHLHMDEWELPK